MLKRTTFVTSAEQAALVVSKEKGWGANPASFVWRKKFECWFPVEGQDAHSKCSHEIRPSHRIV